MSVHDAVDGSHHRHRDVPKCGVISRGANDWLWLRLLKKSFCRHFWIKSAEFVEMPIS